MSKYYNVALQAFLRIIACITVCVQVKKVRYVAIYYIVYKLRASHLLPLAPRPLKVPPLANSPRHR